VLCEAARRRFAAATLGGRLLLVDGLLEEGDALLLAAGIAGAASLVIHADTEAVRHSVRNGIVDFAVNTLDEALRILKNQVRRQQPVAVLLEGDRRSAAEGLAERGVQPDLVRCSESDPECRPLRTLFEQRGAMLLPEDVAELDTSRDVLWRSPGSSAVLRQIDLLAAQMVPADDLERQNWIARAPRYLPRALRTERCLWMEAAEYREFLAAIEERAAQGTLAGGVTVIYGAETRHFA
jgi:urocanate hydratase